MPRPDGLAMTGLLIKFWVRGYSYLTLPSPTKERVLSNSNKSGDSSLRSEWQNEWWKYTKFVIPNLFRNLSAWLWLKLIDSKAIRNIPKILRFWNKFRMTKFLVKSSGVICSEWRFAKSKNRCYERFYPRRLKRLLWLLFGIFELSSQI